MMPEEFEGDLSGSVFWGAELRDAVFRDVDLTGSRISHALVVDVEIDAFVDRFVVNGVDVTAYVNEHDAWYPLRAMLRPDTPEEMRATCAALETEWAVALARVQALPTGGASESVNGEFSFVQTLQHVVFAMDKWFIAPIAGGDFAPLGLPNKGSLDFGWPNVVRGATPTFDEVLAVRAERVTRFRDYLATVAAAEFDRPVEIIENGTTSLKDCIGVVFEEEFWHLRYAVRDLAILEAQSERQPGSATRT